MSTDFACFGWTGLRAPFSVRFFQCTSKTKTTKQPINMWLLSYYPFSSVSFSDTPVDGHFSVQCVKILNLRFIAPPRSRRQGLSRLLLQCTFKVSAELTPWEEQPVQKRSVANLEWKSTNWPSAWQLDCNWGCLLYTSPSPRDRG